MQWLIRSVVVAWVLYLTVIFWNVAYAGLAIVEHVFKVTGAQ
jgi:hypothetical protein